MRPRHLTTALLVTLVFAFPSHAQDKKGWGIAFGVGVSQIKDKDPSDTFDGNAFGYSLEGEYRFTPNLAFGLSIADLGEADDTFNGVNTSIDVIAVGFFFRGIVPASDNVDIYGRIGGVNYHADLDPGGSTGFSGEDAVELGAGVDIGNGEHFSYRIEGRYLDGPRDESGALLTVGFSYRF